MTINAYLTFDGNCEEAFNYYKSVFGGDFEFMGRMKDMPPSDDYTVPEEQKNCIMHVSLPISKECTLMGSDTLSGMSPPMKQGNNFSISVAVASRDDADRVFSALSSDGQTIMPMQDVFWGSYFGMCTDQFGIQWMVNYSTNQHQ